MPEAGGPPRWIGGIRDPYKSASLRSFTTPLGGSTVSGHDAPLNATRQTSAATFDTSTHSQAEAAASRPAIVSEESVSSVVRSVLVGIPDAAPRRPGLLEQVSDKARRWLGYSHNVPSPAQLDPASALSALLGVRVPELPDRSAPLMSSSGADAESRTRAMHAALHEVVGLPPKAIAQAVVDLPLGSIEQLTFGVALRRAVAEDGDVLPDGIEAPGALRGIASREIVPYAPEQQATALGNENRLARLVSIALTHCVDTPCFPRLAGAVVAGVEPGDVGTGDSVVGALRRCLQAREALSRPETMPGEHAFAAQIYASSRARMLDRVQSQAAAAQRHRPALAPDPAGTAHFYWDCGFRSEAPGSPLAMSRAMFDSWTAQLAKEDGGLLQPVRDAGLLGATFHNRSDIAGFLGDALRAVPVAEAPTDDPYTGVLHHLANKVLPHANQDIDAALGRLARMGRQTPAARAHEVKSLADACRTAGALQRILTLSPEAGMQLVTGVEHGQDARTVAMRAEEIGYEIAPRVRAEIASALARTPSLDLGGLLDGAQRWKEPNAQGAVAQALARTAPLHDAVRADGRPRPIGTLAGARQAIVDFLSRVYFGNHLLVGEGSAYNLLGTRGTMNIARIARLNDADGATNSPLPQPATSPPQASATESPSWSPSVSPSASPSESPSQNPSRRPTGSPSQSATRAPVPAMASPPSARGGTAQGGSRLLEASTPAPGGWTSWAKALIPSLSFNFQGYSQVNQLLIRLGAATHGGEIFIGNEGIARTGIAVGGPVSWLTTGPVVMTASASGGVQYENTGNKGLMFRIARVGSVPDQDDPLTTQRFQNNDATVRTLLATLADRILTAGVSEMEGVSGAGGHGAEFAAQAPSALDRVVDSMVARDDSHLLSLQWTERPTTRWSRTGTLGLYTGARIPTGTQSTRMGLGVSAELRTAYRTTSGGQIEPTTTRFSVNAARSGAGSINGWSAAVPLSLQDADRQASGILADVGRIDEDRADGAVTVKVRAPREHGRIVAEKTFLDIETGNLDRFEKLVRAEADSWRGTFDFRAQQPEVAGAGGPGAVQDELAAFFASAKATRNGDHVYYLRKRLHPLVAGRLDELSTLASTVQEPAVRASIVAESDRIVADPRVWEFASLIVYQKQGRTNKEPPGRAVPIMNTALLSSTRFRFVESEREIEFTTGGWTPLHRQEMRPERLTQIAELLSPGDAAGQAPPLDRDASAGSPLSKPDDGDGPAAYDISSQSARARILAARSAAVSTAEHAEQNRVGGSDSDERSGYWV